MSSVRYELDDQIVTRHSKVARHDHHDHRHTPTVLATLLKAGQVRAELDIFPPGVVSVRTGGGYEQIVIVEPPAITTVIWGQFENDRTAGHHLVAQPYRVLIGEWGPGGFLGGRLFYSPDPVRELDAPLYHANVPNLNCLGYGGTAVGWICLYHDGQRHETTAARATYLGKRLSGNEAYNTANMAGTDGPTFYRRHRAPAHLVDPTAWERMTDKEGLDWVLSAPWVPVLVHDIDHQDAHVEGGVPLTLEMAMTGNAKFYYQDPDHPRLYNALARGLHPDQSRIFDALGAAFAAAPPTVQPPSAAVAPTDAELDHELPGWTPPEPGGSPSPGVLAAGGFAQAQVDAGGGLVMLQAPPGFQATFQCGWCSQPRALDAYAAQWSDTPICALCRDEEFSYCCICDTWAPHEHLVWSEGVGEYYCPSCYQEAVSNGLEED